MGTISFGIICFIAVLFVVALFLIFLLMLVDFILWALKPVFWLIGCTYDKIAYSLTQGKKIKILPQNKPKKHHVKTLIMMLLLKKTRITFLV